MKQNNKSEILRINYKGLWLICGIIALFISLFFSGYMVAWFGTIGLLIGFTVPNLYTLVAFAYVGSESNELRILELENRINKLRKGKP